MPWVHCSPRDAARGWRCESWAQGQLPCWQQELGAASCSYSGPAPLPGLSDLALVLSELCRLTGLVTVSRPGPTLTCCSAPRPLLAGVWVPASPTASLHSLLAYLEQQPAPTAPWWYWLPSWIWRSWQCCRKPPWKLLEGRSSVTFLEHILKSLQFNLFLHYF